MTAGQLEEVGSLHVHAVVSVWNVEKGREEEQQRGLEQLVPMVQRAPGFVAGYWTSDLESGKAYTMIVLESEQAAQQFKAMVESNPPGAAVHAATCS